MIDDEIFCEVPWTFRTQVFLESLLRVRRDLYVDPLLTATWSCDPARCRPRLGENLCCKVERRCGHLAADRCSIHDDKPFSCALFPLDLIRVGTIRAVTTVRNRGFFDSGWSRYDRDMLQCFEGVERGAGTMFDVQRPVLARIFTRSELILMERRLRSGSPEETGATAP